MATPTVEEIVKDAMFRALTEEAREKLIKDAITLVNTPSERAYGAKGPTPLQDAFSFSIRKEVGAQLEKAINEDPRAKQFVAAVVEAMLTKMLDDALVKTIAEVATRQLCKALEEVRY